MRLVLQIALLSLFPNVLCTPSDEAPESAPGSLKSEVAALKDQLREESMNLKEVMYSLFGDKQSSLLLFQVIDLIKEVKDMQGVVQKQGERIEGMESKLAETVEGMESKLVEKVEEMESKLVETMEEMKTGLVENVKGMESKLIESVGEVDLKINKVDSKVEVRRSELRLISQQKMTWQNSTYANKLFSDYAVDGVYTGSGDIWGLNPIQHIGSNHRNSMLIVDLGGFFKIHTVKVWNRADCCQSQSLGVVVYADEEILGTINESKLLYNFLANDQVYASKIYLKQSIPNHMNFREVQVFGTGPYNEDEVGNC